MKEERRHKLFKDIVSRFAEESHCEYIKVAAIAVKDGRIIATGINGSPRNSINCDVYFQDLWTKTCENGDSYSEWKNTREWRVLHHQWADVHEIHAEQSLICEAARRGISLKDSDIYISYEPCIHCSKLLIGLHPKNVYFIHTYDKSDPDSKMLFEEQSINIEQI